MAPRNFDDADMAILHNLGIETDAVIHNARPGTLYDEVRPTDQRRGSVDPRFTRSKETRHPLSALEET